MQFPKRLLWALSVLLLLIGASATVAQSASAGATPLPTKSSDVVLQSPLTGLAQSEPAHWVTGLQPHTSGAQDTEESHNWSGYVDTGPQFTGASAAMGGAIRTAVADSLVLSHVGRRRRCNQFRSHPDRHGPRDIGGIHFVLRVVRDFAE